MIKSIFFRSAKNEKPVFLLGVGAQKAATTWLYKYLNEHPQCAMGPIKEQSVFQTYFQRERFQVSEIVKMQNLVRYLQASIKQVQDGDPTFNPDQLIAHLDNLAMNHDLGRYWQTFDTLRTKNPDARVLGDITPEYAGLTAENFAEVRQQIIAQGFAPKVVYLMRDPVERCYSMLRMADRNSVKLGKSVSRPAHERFVEDSTSAWSEIYTRYERTIAALETAFQPDEIFYGFYETFLTVEELGRCCAFLGIDQVPAKFESKVNWSPREIELEEVALQSVRDFYRETYNFCMQRFGSDFIGRIWKYT